MKKALFLFLVVAASMIVGCDNVGPPMADQTSAANNREKAHAPGTPTKDVQLTITPGK